MLCHSNYLQSRSIPTFLVTISLLAAVGCEKSTDVQRLRLATATSTRDSGLLDQILPKFEQQHDMRVEVIATGTGRAIKLGEAGDVDVLLVHAREAEQAFLAAGHGVRREAMMKNQFELVGPADDPAEVRGKQIVAALKKIASDKAKFVSRGDQSGTHLRELKFWQQLDLQPTWDNYIQTGQGMGATLMIAEQMKAYTLVDRATYLKFREKIDLQPLIPQSDLLENPYSVLVVDSRKHSSVRANLAQQFASYLIAPETQQLIADYQIDGQPLFVPLRLPSSSDPQVK